MRCFNVVFMERRSVERAQQRCPKHGLKASSLASPWNPPDGLGSWMNLGTKDGQDRLLQTRSDGSSRGPPILSLKAGGPTFNLARIPSRRPPRREGGHHCLDVVSEDIQLQDSPPELCGFLPYLQVNAEGTVDDVFKQVCSHLDVLK